MWVIEHEQAIYRCLWPRGERLRVMADRRAMADPAGRPMFLLDVPLDEQSPTAEAGAFPSPVPRGCDGYLG
jgi:hypothetical protein